MPRGSHIEAVTSFGDTYPAHLDSKPFSSGIASAAMSTLASRSQKALFADLGPCLQTWDKQSETTRFQEHDIQRKLQGEVDNSCQAQEDVMN